MSALTGNKYAEKWTFERTVIALSTVDRFSLDPDYLYLGHALDAAGLYDDVWRYWGRKWGRRYEILDMMKKIMQRFEVRLFEKMAKKEIPATVAMFALKHHYGWGKEPKDTSMDDYTYVDREPVHEPAADATAPAEPQLPASEAPRKKVQQIKPMYNADYSLLKKLQYNAAHPDHKIVCDVHYLDGEPPQGVEAVRFEKGWFWRE